MNNPGTWAITVGVAIVVYIGLPVVDERFGYDRYFGARVMATAGVVLIVGGAFYLTLRGSERRPAGRRRPGESPAARADPTSSQPPSPVDQPASHRPRAGRDRAWEGDQELREPTFVVGEVDAWREAPREASGPSRVVRGALKVSGSVLMLYGIGVVIYNLYQFYPYGGAEGWIGLALALFGIGVGLCGFYLYQRADRR